MPTNLGIPISSSSKDKINDIKLLATNQKDSFLKKQKNDSSDTIFLSTSPWTDNLRHPHLLKYYSIRHLHASEAHKQTSTRENIPSEQKVEPTNMNTLFYNEQCKSAPRNLTSTSKADGSSSKQQISCNESSPNSHGVASLRVSIQIPMNQFNKSHGDPKKTSDHSSPWLLGNGINSKPESTSTGTLNDTPIVKSGQKFVKYRDGSVLHLKSRVHLKKHPKRRTSNEMKTIGLQTENLNSDHCKHTSEDNISAHATKQTRSNLERSNNTNYKLVEPKNMRTVNTPFWANTNSRELGQEGECCFCPLNFESSNSTTTIKYESQTKCHAFEDLRESPTRNNIMLTNHSSCQLNQKENKVHLNYVPTSKTETTHSQDYANWQSSINKKTVNTNTFNQAVETHLEQSASANDTCGFLYGGTCFIDDTHEYNSACGLSFNNKWGDTEQNDEGYVCCNLSFDDNSVDGINEIYKRNQVPMSLKCTNPCQLEMVCSQKSCKRLLWNDDSLETQTDDCNTQDTSNLICGTKDYIIDSQNETEIPKRHNSYDNHREPDSEEYKSNKANLLKPNVVLHQTDNEQVTESNDRTLCKSRELRRKRQNRPSYKLSWDSNFSDNYKVAQHIERDTPEYASDIHNNSNSSHVAQNTSHVYTSTKQASVSCLKRKNEKKNESYKKVHFSKTINSHIISPCYETSVPQKNKNCYCIRSNVVRQSKVSQSKSKDKKLPLKHSSLEKQLKSKLRYGTKPKKSAKHRSIFGDTTYPNDSPRHMFLTSTGDEVFDKDTIQLVSTPTSSTEYIMSASTPFTSKTPSSSESSIKPYEIYYTALNVDQNLKSYPDKTINSSINAKFSNPCVDHWKNNSTSFYNLSSLDVSNEIKHHARREVKARMFLSEIPINLAKKSSSIECNATSDSDEHENKIMHFNDERVSYPVFRNTSRKIKTNIDDHLHGFSSVANSFVQSDAENHRPCHRKPKSKECTGTDFICKNTRSGSNQQDTCNTESHPMLMKKSTCKSIGIETNNYHGKKCCSKRHVENSSVKYANCRTEMEVKSSQDPGFLSELNSQIKVRETSNSPIVQIYKNDNWDLKFNKNFKMLKPNWDEIATTVNELQMICNDHTLLSEQSKNSLCSSNNDTDSNNSSKTRSILAAQACVEVLQKQLGFRG